MSQHRQSDWISGGGLALMAIVIALHNGGMALGSDIAKWTFDDGTAYDVTGNGHNGTIIGAAAELSPLGQALRFSSFNDYVDVPDSPALQLQNWFYIEARFMIDPNTDFDGYDSMTLLSKGATPGALYADYNLKAIDTNSNRIPDSIDFEISPPSGPHTSLTSSQSISVGQWHTAGVLFNYGNVELTVDGTVVGTANLGFTPIRASTESLYIGRRYTGDYDTANTNQFSGWIEEVTIAIPEPTSLCLLTIGGSLLLRRRAA